MYNKKAGEQMRNEKKPLHYPELVSLAVTFLMEIITF